MIRQPTLRTRVFGRATIGLLGVATALLLAPTVLASPESDASDAITEAWQASGGDDGPLGPASGDVYAAGVGFAQNFASGKMFFTPDTGARLMQGPILEKYESLGGPADSDLGFPNIDEGPGRAPGSLNSTFSASDNPVIFWTSETGARVVRGPINAAWDELGGSSGVLGVPAADVTYDGPVATQKFSEGELSYDSRSKKFTTVPPGLADQLTDLAVPDDPVSAINAARRAAGGRLGPLGAAKGAPYRIGANGFGQDFANGKIFYSPNTGANVVTGQVLAKYESVGGPEGDLGFPITSETDGGVAPASRMSTFAAPDKPVIFWTPDHGAVIVRGPMNAAWEKLGGATGEIGVPKADQTQNGDVISQQFSDGTIAWNSETKKFRTEPTKLASQLAGLEVPEQEAPPPPASQTDKGSYFRWTWWWLLAVVPILLLVALVAVAALRNRRSGDDDDLFGSYIGDGSDDGRGFASALAAEDPRDEPGREDALFGDRYAREGLGSLTPAGPAAPSTSDEFSSEPLSFWGAPVQTESPYESDDEFRELGVEQEDPDAVDTAPTRIPTAAEIVSGGDSIGTSEQEPSDVLDREPAADAGRHARADVDEPMPTAPVLHLPLDEPGVVPEGYPIKADTKSGLYWTPESADYDEAPAEIWFVSEEIARANGFTPGE